MLKIDGKTLKKDRIIGWERSSDNDGFYIDLITDMGGKIRIYVSWFDYDNQLESNIKAEKKYEEVEAFLMKELHSIKY